MLKIVIKDICLNIILEYPKNLHGLHNDLPFLPEK